MLACLVIDVVVVEDIVVGCSLVGAGIVGGVVIFFTLQETINVFVIPVLFCAKGRVEHGAGD